MGISKLSLSIPTPLLSRIDDEAAMRQQSRSELVSELLLHALERAADENAENEDLARLTSELEKTKRALDQARAASRGSLIESPAREARSSDRPPPKAAKAIRSAEARAAAAEAAFAKLSRECSLREADLAKRKVEYERVIAALNDEVQKRTPWYIHIPIPILSLHAVSTNLTELKAFQKGIAASVISVLLLLALWPHDSTPMRRVAALAMGKPLNIPLAAARLHAGPFLGADDFLQVYVLVRAADNADRLRACVSEAEQRLGFDGPGTVDCVLQIPSFHLAFADLATSGPHAPSPSLFERMEALERTAGSDGGRKQGQN